LLEDLLRAESVGSYQNAPGQGAGLTVAARLGPERAPLWQTNWSSLLAGLGAGPLADVQGEGYAGWEAKWPGTTTVSRLLQAGDWTVLTWGAGEPPLPTAWLARIKTSGRPVDPDKEAWLRVDADLARLAPLLHWPAGIAWPQAEVRFFGRYAAPLKLKLEPWRVPTNTVSDPLVAFSAVQGLRPWFSEQAWVKDLALPSVPNQVFAWAQGTIPLRTYLTWELAEVTNALRQLAPRLPGLTTNQVYWTRFGRIIVETNRARLTWGGLPLAEPFLQVASPGDAGFVVSGIFPLEEKFQRPPSDLYSQVLGRTNLVYYDWELTQVRLDDWRRLKEVYGMVAGYDPPNRNTPAYNWLTNTNVNAHLANAATELTLVSPTDLDLVRSSSLGLTGLELVSLMEWIDDPAFPGHSARSISPALKRRDQAASRGSGAPAPPPGPTRAPDTNATRTPTNPPSPAPAPMPRR
jgi:hypothetical protein